MRRNSFSGKKQFSKTRSGGSRKPSFGGRRSSFFGSRKASKGRDVYIDASKFIRKVTSLKSEDTYTPKHTFGDFGLNDKLLKNVSGYGYTTPTSVQDEGIIPIREGRDLIGLANTGTGKTAAFLLPIMEKLCKSKAREAVLIVTPTRELAGQIAEEFRIFAHGLELSAVVVVGGAPIYRQIASLKRGPNVIIGTPGRILDLVKQRKLRLDRIKTFVLDEADHMMDMGFLPDVRAIVSYLPAKRQTLCFSATLPLKIDQLVRDLLVDPITISVRTGITCDNVDQNILYADTVPQKINVLIDLFKKEEFSKVLIFGRTKHGVQKLADNLSKFDLKVEAIHGNKSQNQRQKALRNFKNNKVNILVATDVAARGIDVPNVSHVINFDQPSTYDDYIHRIGRTGRAGKLGKALTFISMHTRI